MKYSTEGNAEQPGRGVGAAFDLAADAEQAGAGVDDADHAGFAIIVDLIVQVGNPTAEDRLFEFLGADQERYSGDGFIDCQCHKASPSLPILPFLSDGFYRQGRGAGGLGLAYQSVAPCAGLTASVSSRSMRRSSSSEAFFGPVKWLLA